MASANINRDRYIDKDRNRDRKDREENTGTKQKI